MTYRARNIALAVALAVVAALLTGFYVTNYKRTVQHGEHHVTVLVAARDIPSGTPGSELRSSSFLRAVSVPRRDVVPGSVSQPAQLDRLVATQPTYAGEQVSTRRFSSPTNSGVRAQLKGPLRAVQVSGTADQVLAGTLRNGDHVDVVASVELREASAAFSRIVLRDLVVLKAPDGPSKADSRLQSSSQEFPIMLAVSDTQVQKLWYTVNKADGKANGWSLALRPAVNESDSAEVIEWYRTVLLEGLNRFQLRRAETGGLR
jgi:Flp pilus assembly protein CpaB